jgi:predicted RecA/RadA family phage recombinase
MSQLARKFLRIFGGDVSPTGSTAEFGSCIEGSPQYSSDPADIQSRSAFLNGFRPAVFASRFPFLEDMQALFYLATRQLSYLYQQGVPEWDATTEYHSGSVVQSGGMLFISIADTNINHAVSDALWWAVVGSPTDSASLARFTPTQALVARAVAAWDSRTSAADNQWTSVCWAPELGLFCAVSENGDYNQVMTSPDGINWDLRVTPANNSKWWAVCWSAELGLFCAVAWSGLDGLVMTSPDGIEWTIQVAASTNQWKYVCWSPELGLFCAVAETGAGDGVMTSPDGVTWTSQTSASDIEWRAVCWSRERSVFCAVATTGTGNRVMTSKQVGLLR